MSQIKQITDPDMRFYEVEPGIFYPSMTTVLGAGLPTPPHLVKWWKQNGFMSDFLMEKAGKEGTVVHNAIEDFLNGAELNIEDYDKNIFLWEMICKFAQFFFLHVQEVHEIELKSHSHKLQLAGMMDLICTLKDGHVWLIDFKTSNYVSDKFGPQTLGYKIFAQETNGYQIDKRGVLHLKAKTRGPRNGKIQGKGWQLIEQTDDEGDWKKLKIAIAAFKAYNPNAKPNLRRYPVTLSMAQPFNPDDYTFDTLEEDGE